MNTCLLLSLVVAQPEAIGPGDHTRTIMMGEQKRTYIFHVPKDYDPKKPAPVVLALHGAAMNGSMMVWFSGLDKTSDKEGFIVVYPSGTGTGPFLTWNAGGFKGNMAEGRGPMTWPSSASCWMTSAPWSRWTRSGSTPAA